jgi:hypothetical protein
MDLDQEHLIPLTGRELMLLRAGLTVYLRDFAAHSAADGGQSHPAAEGEIMKRQFGELIWRLETAGVPAGADVEHSAEAVRPEPA